MTPRMDTAQKEARLATRFWAKVEQTDTCWLWRGATSGSGYGRAKRPSGMWQAHRLAWLYTHGRIPRDLDVLHRCDVKLCVSPQHLYLGTDIENSQDRIDRGRANAPRGEASPQARLTEDAVREIRRSTESQRALARRFGVTRIAIRFARTGRTWRHVA